eukprot:scaffold2060_cov161-Alexandrium_tamarense.AAC.8
MARKKAPAKPMSRQSRKYTTMTIKLSSNSSNNDTTVGASSFRGILNPPYRNYPSHPLHPMLLVVPPEHLGPQYAPCKCCQVIVLSILRLSVLCHGVWDPTRRRVDNERNGVVKSSLDRNGQDKEGIIGGSESEESGVVVVSTVTPEPSSDEVAESAMTLFTMALACPRRRASV